MTTTEDPRRREADDLFDARGIADEHRDPELVALERSLAPLTAHVPPLPALPPRTSAPVSTGNQPEKATMTLPPAIPSSTRPSSAPRGIVFGAVALAAVATLALVWATRPPEEVPEPDDEQAVAVVSTTPNGTAASPLITLAPPSAAVFELAELGVMPLDSEVARVFWPEDVRQGHGRVALTSNGFEAVMRAARRESGSVYLAKSANSSSALRFDVELPAGEYLACGALTEGKHKTLGGCAAIEVGSSGIPSPASLELERVEASEPNQVTPDLKDPFASSSEPQPREKKQPRKHNKKSVDSDDLKDPFGSRRSSGAVSPSLEDPSKSKSKSNEDDGWDERGVLDPWSDDGDEMGDGAAARPKKKASPNLKDPYGR